MKTEDKNTDKGSNDTIHSVSSRSDVWNPMIKLINETKDTDIREQAKALLGQYNTASGIRIKHELENFLVANGY